MNRLRGKKIPYTEHKWKKWLFKGVSEGGLQTSIVVPRFKLMFDVGRGSPRTTEVPRLFLTHGHLDHASGVPYYASQRALRKLPPAEVYVPPDIAENLEKILNLWSEIEGFPASCKIIPLDYTTSYALRGNAHIRAIPSYHRVPSNGYTIFEKVTKLKKQFLHLPGREIAARKQRGEDLFVTMERPLVSFSGDTKIEWVLENPCVQNSQILFLECTYICEKRPVERARKWGHIHLDEIAAHAEAFQNVERLFLIHFSPRYSHGQIRTALKQKLPDWLYQKTHPFL